MKREPLLLFVHIPKAAGNTVLGILKRQYGDDGVFSTTWGPSPRVSPSRAFGIFVGVRMNPQEIWFPELLQDAASRFHQLPDEQRALVRAIRGFHIEFGLHEHLPQQNAYFTLLRDPVERVISHYYFTADFENGTENVSPYEHITTRIDGNLQTKILSGAHGEGPLPPPDEMLERAKCNLRTCAVVGLTERFDETVLLLRNAFDWRMPFYVPVNVNKKRPPIEAIPTDILRQIEADNQLDAVLYKYAQQLFEEQVKAYGPSFGSDLRRFQALNLLRQRWCHLKRLPRKMLTVLYRAMARWGGLRHLVPSRLCPRVVPAPANGKLCVALIMGERVVGEYDFGHQRWVIRRPCRLFVDESKLPPLMSIELSLHVTMSPKVLFLKGTRRGGCSISRADATVPWMKSVPACGS